eukprot:1134476-Pelagomonas_calceolata.AAC.1
MEPSKHYVWPEPEYKDFFSMLSRYFCHVWEPRCTWSGSWRAVGTRVFAPLDESGRVVLTSEGSGGAQGAPSGVTAGWIL